MEKVTFEPNLEDKEGVDENRREVMPSWVSNMRETGRGRCGQEEQHQFILPGT